VDDSDLVDLEFFDLTRFGSGIFETRSGGLCSLFKNSNSPLIGAFLYPLESLKKLLLLLHDVRTREQYNLHLIFHFFLLSLSCMARIRFSRKVLK
jgi:hypothetical protein